MTSYRATAATVSDLLNEVLAHRLTLLVGDGASEALTALRALASRQDVPLVSLPLDPENNHPRRFLARLEGALVEAFDGWPGPSFGDNAGLEEGVIGLLNGLLDVPDDLLVILIGYENVTAPAIHDAVAFMLDYLPPQVHFVIASRSEPPLPNLARLRVRRQLLMVK